MDPLPPNIVASVSRSVPLRKRADLVSVQQVYRGYTTWVIKDPLALTYARLDDEECAVLDMLDGETSLEQMQVQFESRFAPRKISHRELSDLIGKFHSNGLVISTAPGQGEQLVERRDTQRRRAWLGRLANPLAIRFRGFNPQRVFDVLYPRVRWMFSTPAIVAGLLLMASALLLVTVKFETFHARLPTFHQYFTLDTAWVLMAVLATTKILHELGHGLACKHFGGECPELGAMLLVFTPCLYCNVSDAWMLPSRWQRIAIGAAGICVELLLASAATFVWWFTAPGLVHHLALNVMFVCSVSTVVFNANPLMRYDGYFILADLLEMPNLAQNSAAALRDTFAETFLGIERDTSSRASRGPRAWLILYAIASAIYRWIIVFSILWFLYEASKPYRLQLLVYVVAVMMLGSLVIPPLIGVVRFIRNPGHVEQMKRHRMWIIAIVGAGTLAMMALMPMPRRVFGATEVEPRDPQNVYACVPGVLAEVLVKPGQHVQAGTVLARLENIDLDLQVVELSTKRDRYAAQAESLRQLRFADATKASQLPEFEQSVAAFDQQLFQKQHEREQLTLVADREGVVLPPPENSRPSSEGELRTWTGSPLDRRNLGCFVEAGALICQIAETDRYDAVIVVDENDVTALRKGQQVAVRLDAFPMRTFEGQIEEIGHDDLKLSPRHLSNKTGGALATKTDASGAERPMTVSYQARVSIACADGELCSGCRGRAKVSVPWQSASSQVWRWFRQTFHFTL